MFFFEVVPSAAFHIFLHVAKKRDFASFWHLDVAGRSLLVLNFWSKKCGHMFDSKVDMQIGISFDSFKRRDLRIQCCGL